MHPFRCSLRPETSKDPDERFYWRWALVLWAALMLLAWLSRGCEGKPRDRAAGSQSPAAMQGAGEPGGGQVDAPVRGMPAKARVATRRPGRAAEVPRAGLLRRPSHGPAARTDPERRAAAARRRPGKTPGAVLPPLPGDADLGAEVRRLYDTLFCVGRAPDGPCRKLTAAIAAYRKRYLAPMRAWMRQHLPDGLPETLLYPFSGGDLLSAISAFPSARQLVHLSLEHGGPPDPLRGRSPAQIRDAHYKLYFMANLLLTHGESFSVDLQKQEQAMLPGVLPLLLVGLRVHGGTPTGLAYLELRPDGTVRPYRRAELTAAAPRARRLYTTWKDPRFSARFSNVELRFRLPGDTADRRVIHLSANLANPGLARHPGVGRLVTGLGPVAVMLKAASYLLWTDGFSRARDLIFAKARFAVSDLTAPYPQWLTRRGFEVTAHGRYDCMKNPRLRGAAQPWIRLFRKPASRQIPFRWGYVDCRGQNHIVLIRRRAPAPRR